MPTTRVNGFIVDDVTGALVVSGSTVAPGTGLTDAELRAAAVGVVDVAVRDRLPAALDGGALNVADVFTGGEVLADQVGATSVLTFTFAVPVDLVWVRAASAARVDPFGGVPTASLGIPCAADEPHPITVRTSVVRVFAISNVSVWGYRG